MARQFRTLGMLAIIVVAFGVALVAAPARSAAAQTCTGVADIALVADTSGSIGGDGASATRNFFNGIVSGFTVNADNANFAIAGFSSSATVYQSMTGNLPAIQAAIGVLSSGGGTDLPSGLTAGIAELNAGRPGVPKILVITSDGDSGGSTSISIAATAKAAGIIIFTVGVGAGTSPSDLIAIASQPSYYVDVSDFAALNGFVATLVSSTCVLSGGSGASVAGCQLNVPSGSVVGSIPFGATAFYSPNKETNNTDVFVNAGSYWVIGLDSTETFYKIVLACQFLWVPREAVGPYYDGVNWFNNPLPTGIVS